MFSVFLQFATAKNGSHWTFHLKYFVPYRFFIVKKKKGSRGELQLINEMINQPTLFIFIENFHP